MGTQLLVTQEYAAGLSEVRAMLLDPDYIHDRAIATGALTVEHTRSDDADGSTDLVIIRTLPAKMPAFAAAIVGETLTITERQHWEPLGDGGCAGTFQVEFSAPLAFTGTMVLAGIDGRTTVVTDGEFKAAVPFLGGKVERLAHEQTERYLVNEQRFANQWLAGA